MAFPFLKSLDAFIYNELKTRIDPIKASQLVPWIQITSNLGGGYEIGSASYPDLFGANGMYHSDNAARFRPRPVIADFSVDFASRGTLRKATFKIKCFTVDDLSKLQEYFLEPGISCFIQWGWNKSLISGKSILALEASAANVNTYNRNPQSLNEIRSANNGCYDNMVGIITGGESFINGEEYGVTVKVCSIGEILMGRSQESVTDDKEKISTRPAFSSEEIEAYKATPQLNYAYAFNTFPAEHRTNTIKGWINDKTKVDVTTDFIGFNESLIEEATEETKKGSTLFGLISFNQDVQILGKQFSARDNSSPVSPKKYIRFRNFVDMLNETRLKLSEDGGANFTIDLENVYIGAFRRMFSTDDRVFIPNKTMVNFFWNEPYYAGSDTPVAQILDPWSLSGRKLSFVKTETTSFTMKDGTSVTLDPFRHGWLGDVFVDTEVLYEALRDVKRPIKEVLDGVLKVLEDSVEGLWNFQIVEDGNKLRISDGNLRNDKAGIEIPSFYMTGTQSFFLDASFNLDIPKAMASKVVMQKSVEGGSISGDGDPDQLTGLFSNQKDTKLAKIKVESNEDDKAAAKTLTADEIKKNGWIDLRRNIRILVDPTITKKGDIDSDLNKWAIYGIYLNKKYFNTVRKADSGMGSSSKPVTSGRPLPVKFNFTTLGMSGFQVGQLFKVIGLPPQYTNVGLGAFMITEVTHKVDNKQWTTSVEAMFKPFYR
jgi:hypothetical protein